MKKLLFIIVVMFLTGALFAQEKSNYEKYWEAREDSIVESQKVVENPVIKSDKPITIFDRMKESKDSKPEGYNQGYVEGYKDANENYIGEPFYYSSFFSPFSFSLTFGLWGYPYYGYPYHSYYWWDPWYSYYWWDPWYYPYYGYPYYGHRYYWGYGGHADHGVGMLGSHNYGYGYSRYESGSTNHKSFANSYPMTRRSSSYKTTNNFASKSRTQLSSIQSNRRSYISPENKPVYSRSKNKSYSPNYSQPRMSTRPSYNNSKGSYSNQSQNRTMKNSYPIQNRTSRSYSTTPRSSSSKSYSMPSRSSNHSAPSRSSGSYGRGSFGGSSGSKSSGSYGSGHRK